MKKSLKKGYFHLELNHEYGTDTVGAEEAEIELSDDIATFRAKLRPASDDQSADANQSKERDFKNVEYFSFLDKHIRKAMASFAKAHRAGIKGWRIEIEYGEKYSFDCEVQPTEPGGVMFHVVGA